MRAATAALLLCASCASTPDRPRDEAAAAAAPAAPARSPLDDPRIQEALGACCAIPAAAPGTATRFTLELGVAPAGIVDEVQVLEGAAPASFARCVRDALRPLRLHPDAARRTLRLPLACETVEEAPAAP